MSQQFYPFATAGGAYVLSNADYLALAARSTGYPTGLLTKEALNSAIRQSAFVSYAISKWTNDTGGLDTLDNGVVDDYIDAFKAAFNAAYKAQQDGTFKVYAGNPNGFVAGVQGNPATPIFPTVVYDITNNLWWVCTTSGTAGLAVWTAVGSAPGWPVWCGLATGTAAAQVVTTPGYLVDFQVGQAIAWQVTAGPNVGAVTLQVGAFGTWQLYKDAPGGPVPLTGGELQVGSIVQGRFNGANIQLMDTAMGTAALANASSNTGTVSAVDGPTVVGNIPIFTDTFGTVEDSGTTPGSLMGAAEGIMYQLGLAM